MSFLLAHAFFCFLEREFREWNGNFTNGVGISRTERGFHEWSGNFVNGTEVS